MSLRITKARSLNFSDAENNGIHIENENNQRVMEIKEKDENGMVKATMFPDDESKRLKELKIYQTKQCLLTIMEITKIELNGNELPFILKIWKPSRYQYGIWNIKTETKPPSLSYQIKEENPLEYKIVHVKYKPYVIARIAHNRPNITFYTVPDKEGREKPVDFADRIAMTIVAILILKTKKKERKLICRTILVYISVCLLIILAVTFFTSWKW
ncbi:uncharacterized protein LOC143076736 [Mytilus galloprovincialis]|uniref:uncharacterized protein LOC143076736 n=1 Tax=Mytilus galloprovincialis TaxID=29158 RepID=UPI003F7CD26E